MPHEETEDPWKSSQACFYWQEYSTHPNYGRTQSWVSESHVGLKVSYRYATTSCPWGFQFSKAVPVRTQWVNSTREVSCRQATQIQGNHTRHWFKHFIFHKMLKNLIKLVMSIPTVGVQARLPQDISQGHSDYLELKSLKKQQEIEELSDSSLSP